MARIYLSPLIVDIRNKQSDTVFSKWKGINYIRSRVIPANPKTAAQVAIREALAQLVSLWQDMEAEVKPNWDSYVSGRDYSGFNHFIGKNAVSERDDVLLNITQEVGFTVLSVWTPSTGGDPGEIDVAFAPDPVPADTTLQICQRIAGEPIWNTKDDFPATTASPVTITVTGDPTVRQVYGYLHKTTTPTGEDVGKDESGTATPGVA